MTRPLQAAMADALRLTRAGRLGEAAAAIRAGVAGGPPAAAGHAAPPVPLRPALAPPAPAPVGGGRIEERSHAGPAGRIGYRLYVPAGATAGMPLLVMLHGCTQSPEDFARGTGMDRLADEHGLLVAYPRQTRAANAQGCWNWFRPGDQRRDAGEPALIAGITRDVIAAERADAGRSFVAGLSAGGAAAAIMAAAYPDLYAAAGIHSGLACGAASDLGSALAAMRRGPRAAPPTSPGGRFVPVITFHGDRDATVSEANAGAIVAAATALAGPLTTRSETVRTGGRDAVRMIASDAAGRAAIEQWTVHGLAHAWSGGDAAGTFADPAGPDASREMVRFFLAAAG